MPRRLWLLPILLAPALTGCDLDTCGNRVLNVVRSPDGRRAAVVFQRDCGATAGASTQVSLVGPGAGPGDGAKVFILGNEPATAAQWLGADRLLIRYRRGARRYLQESERDGVRIEYRRF